MHSESFFKALESAQKKKASGEPLKESEKTALKGRWYFNFTLPLPLYEQLVEKALQENLKPSQLVEDIILQHLNS